MIGFTTDKLAIYLQDHLAGATFGVQLARRLAGSNEGTPYGPALAGLAEEIAEDRAELERVMQDYGVGSDTLKNTLAWAGEKGGRLKFNGQLRGYSPLSRVLELEGLMAGVRGKLGLWIALQEAGRPELGSPARLAELEARARGQLDTLQEVHRAAAREAYGGDGGAADVAAPPTPPRAGNALRSS